MQPGLVSILIVNWNTLVAVVRCLDALPASIDGALSYEVIVVDNGSVDGSAEALQKRTDITLISKSGESRIRRRGEPSLRSFFR